MRRKYGRGDLIRRAGELAFGRANDCVRLALAGDDDASFDRLDLSPLTELKRGANGVLEMKFVNRLAALELMARLMDEGAQGGTAESFLRAMDEAAGCLGGGDG